MFGAEINSWDQVKQIAEGWTNDLLGREQELSEKRMAICRECPLYNEKTDRCDGKRCIDKITGEITSTPSKSSICGCQCLMKKKTKSPRSHCTRGLW